VLLIEDVTERREMEERVSRMNQLATVGHLAANVAHEIRNPISAIKTAAQFLRKEYQGEALIDQFAGIINEECDRLSKVTSDFLSFARPSALSFQPTSIAGVLERTLQLVGPHLSEQGVQLEQHLDHLPEIPADRDELVQVFLNLLMNAMQAIEGRGRVAVAARRHGADGVEVTISDTGCGIPADSIEQVFKPFYTTKTKGTGLGLAIVRKIVEAHGGAVEISSRPGSGSTCRVILPGSSEEAAPVTTAPLELDLARGLGAGQLHLFPGQ
jgi:two-component system sensor histidine kinase HydH